MLHIDGVEETAPSMPVVVPFHDVFAPISEIAVSKQKTKPPIMQIVLMIALDRIGDHHQAGLVFIAMPPVSGVVAAGLNGLVHLGVGKGLVLSLVPAEAPEHAQIVGEFLFVVVADAILERAEVFVICNG